MTVNGLLATDQPVADLDFSDAGTATYQALQNDFGLIFRVIVTAENTIQFYASEVPAVALPINLKVVR